MAKRDPFLLDEEEAKKQEKEFSGKSEGLICPKRHNLGPCAVCDEVRRLWNTGNKKDEELARQKGAKVNYYLNVVFPDNPDKVVLLEIGKKAGDAIIYGIAHEGWVDIAHPTKGKGREMKITKRKGDGGYNTYSATPDLEKADWSIGKEALENLHNLDNILELVKTEEIFKVSSIKMDETLRFRICPPWNMEEGNKKIMVPVWRHWGVTQAEIDGTSKMDFGEESDDVEPPWEEEPEKSEESEPEKKEGKRPACFGDGDCWDENDDECTSCKWFKKCAKVVGA